MSVRIGSVTIVQHDVVADIDSASLAEAVDPGSYERGVQYVRQHAVVRALWKLSAGALAGTVRGQYGNVYTTTARFSSADGLVHRFERGECSCPVGFNCKHVVALVLTATGALRPEGKGRPDETGRPEEPGGRPDDATAGAGHAMWERSLASLLTSGKAGSPGLPGMAAGSPLAIELTLSVPQYLPWSRPAGPDPLPQLLARLVRPGKNGWVAGGLSWSQLSNLHYSGDYQPSHVRWLKEFYALYKSGAQQFTSSYSYGEEKTIILSAFESARLWPLLDEAEAIGLHLVHSRKRFGTLDSYGHAEVCLDVTAQPGTLSISPVVMIEETPTERRPRRVHRAGWPRAGLYPPRGRAAQGGPGAQSGPGTRGRPRRVAAVDRPARQFRPAVAAAPGAGRAAAAGPRRGPGTVPR